MRLIKKYKNRRLYDTETSQYITIEQLQAYVLEQIDFKIEDSETGKDLTNSILLRMIIKRHNQFLLIS
jgi:polyhydroxyalkanoate synthesis repressor PhaR